MWWKILGVILIVYSLIAGMLIPLGSGVQQISPRKAMLGESVQLKVTGYNSMYTEGEDGLRAWLKLDSTHAISAQKITVTDDQNVTLGFDIPTEIHFNADRYFASLILDNPEQGITVYPSAVLLMRGEGLMYKKGHWPKGQIKNLSSDTQMHFPYRTILYETIRNTYFHVPMWFAMLVMLGISAFMAIKYLRDPNVLYEEWSYSFAVVGTVCGVLGLITGAIWANYTWGAPWSWDIKQNMTAICLLMYGSYFVQRMGSTDLDRKYRNAAIFNIISFVLVIPLLYVIPRLVDSLHPGSGGNPAMGSEDLDNTMRMVFYPAVIGWILFSYWIAHVLQRIRTQERFNYS